MFRTTSLKPVASTPSALTIAGCSVLLLSVSIAFGADDFSRTTRDRGARTAGYRVFTPDADPDSTPRYRPVSRTRQDDITPRSLSNGHRGETDHQWRNLRTNGDWSRDLNSSPPRWNQPTRDRSDWNRGQQDRRPASHHRFPSRVQPTDYRISEPDLRSVPDLNGPAMPQANPWRQEPAPTPRVQSRQPELEQIRRQLTYRYQHPNVVRLLQRMTPQLGATAFRECSSLIDQRHLTPATYQQRAERAVLNLMLAAEDATFARATGLRVTPDQVRQYQHAVGELLRRRPIQSQGDAEQFMNATAQLTSQSLRISPNAVYLEFVYGSAEALDKYSAFEPKADRAAELETETDFANLDGQIVGIGVEIKTIAEGVRVIKVIPGGPAQRGGLRADDVIVSLNGTDVRGRSLDQVVDLISGPVGSRLLVGIVRGGQGKNLITLARAQVKVPTVTDVQILDPAAGVGYLKLDRFGRTSSEEIDQALWTLHRQGMKSLVFDVRSNPGGLLSAAIDISNKFLPCGTIVSTRGRNRGDNSSESANYERTWKLPIVVMVDENSASASEIFAAAIQDNQRGYVVGTPSYGKGTVQTHFPMRSVSATLRLTTAKFYSPAGREMAGAGVTPDVRTTALRDGDAPTVRDDQVRRGVEVARSRENLEMATRAARCKVPSYSLGLRN